MEENPPIIWAPTPHSKKVVLYNLPSPLAYSILGSKEKIKLTFLRVFDNLLLKYLIFCMQWLFWVIYQN